MNSESSFAGRTCPLVMQEGFRVFFLAAAGWAVLAMLLYVLQLSGIAVMSPAFPLVDWHIHEFLFGYTGAVIAGFALTLIVMVGGRIIPAVTREWMNEHGDPALPPDFDVFDGVTIAVSALALGLWAMAPYASTSALLLAFAGVLNFARLARWHGSRVHAEGLLAVLHIAYAFIPVGLLAMALSAFDPLLMPPSAAMHLLTIGAITMMTLAVMTRISLDHTGRPLHADRVILAIYVAMTLSLLARFAYALQPGYGLLLASAALWIVAFLTFLWRFGFLAAARR